MGKRHPASLRRVEPHAQRGERRRRGERGAQHVRPDVEVAPGGVVARERLAHAVDDALVVALLDEGAEQAVPHDQDAAVVAVDAVVVLAVVHAVVGGRDEHPVGPAELADELGVDPVLVQQVDEADHREHHRWHTGDRHRDVERPAREAAGGGLAQRGAEVVVLGGVVDLVRGPEEVDLVAGAVRPVVAEVIEEQGEDPHPNAVRGQRRDAQVLEREHIDAEADDARERAPDLAQDAEVQARQRVRDVIGAGRAPARDQGLDDDGGHEDRDGVEHRVHG